jgi:hypothetical protein
MKPTVECNAEGIVVSSISTWPGWRFVVAPDGSWLQVVPPSDQRVTQRIWKAMPIAYILRIAMAASTTESATG